jgi:dolichol-phosphate mannosyltransferase
MLGRSIRVTILFMPAVSAHQLENESEGLQCSRLSLVIPTLNEAGNIERMLRALDGILHESGDAEYEIIVVDDDSADGTAAIAERFATELPGNVRVIRRTGKASLGTAAVAGWQAAQGDILALMDADFQHPPELIPRLLDAIRHGADIAIGSRYAEGGALSEQWSPIRKLISVGLTGVTRMLLGSALRQVRDPFSGCFAMRREVIEGKRLRPQGFKVLMEVLAKGSYKEVREIPFDFGTRTAGESKLRFGVAVEDSLLLLRLARQARTKTLFKTFR